MRCNIVEVEVDGEATFVVDKTILGSFSGKLKTLYTRGKVEARRESSKIMFPDFPGGPRGFELMSSFCYNNGGIPILPSNLLLLNSVALFMHMDTPSLSPPSSPNLLEQTLKQAESISQWPIPDLLLSISHSPHTHPSPLLPKCLHSLALRLPPHPSWFHRLLVLTPAMVELLAKSMASLSFHHSTITRFLFYYQKAKSGSCSPSSLEEKQRTVEMVIRVLDFLDRRSVSCRSLFGLLRVGLGLNIERGCRSKLEKMIGCVMDQATLDSILLPSPVDTLLLYDVNLVLRFLRAFLVSSRLPLVRVKKVVHLVDMYMAEVAPDPHLKPSKFLALAVSLPDSARDSYDAVYRAIDIYLEVHSAGLTAEEVRKIWSLLKCEKLSTEAFSHLSHNGRFPAGERMVVGSERSGRRGKTAEEEPAVNERLRESLQGMQCRVMELEKVCRQMQGEMKKIIKSKESGPRYQRSLPKFCS